MVAFCLSYRRTLDEFTRASLLLRNVFLYELIGTDDLSAELRLSSHRTKPKPVLLPEVDVTGSVQRGSRSSRVVQSTVARPSKVKGSDTILINQLWYRLR